MSPRTRAGWLALAIFALTPVAPAFAQPVTFAPPATIAVPAGFPGGIAAGDVNRDGLPDLVFTHAGFPSGTVTVLPGAGGGAFGAASAIAFGTLLRKVVIGDVNGDGIPDLAVAEEDIPSQGIWMFLGLPAGGFGAPTRVLALSEPFNVVLADLSRDARLDIVSEALVGGNGLHVSLGDGTGAFGPSTRYAIGTPVDIAVGDVNGDGALDVVVLQSAGVRVLLGDGTGGLGAPSTFPVGAGPRSVAVGDLNRDGRLDIVTANSGDDTVSILLGNGDGTFGAASSVSVGDGSTVVRVADLNGDGIPDLVTANGGSAPAFAGTVSVLMGTGTGGFGPATTLAVAPRTDTLVVDDFDGDGKPDLAVLSQGAAGATAGILSIFLNTTALAPVGPRGAATTLAVGVQPAGLALGDLDRDGRLDLVTADRNGDTISVALGNGDGSFGAATQLAVGPAGTAPESIALADLNRDGLLDAVTANFRAGVASTVSVLLGTGTGSFSAPTSVAVGNGARFVAVGDLNRDGIPDLAVSNYNDGTVSIVLGTGTGGFTAAGPVPVGSIPEEIAIGDLDRDGIPDLAVAVRGANVLAVRLGDGAGGFTSAPDVVVGTEPRAVVIADLNGDGRPDLAIANVESHDVSVALGNGDGTFGPAVSFPAGVRPFALAVADVNRDGRPDLVVANLNGRSVSILLGAGGGAFGAPINVAVGRRPNGIAVGDLDRDGIPDLTVANFDDDSVSVLLPARDQDGDGIADPVDRDRVTGAEERMTPSDDFNDTGLGGVTTGTLADRAGWTLTVVDATPGGVQATLGGAGTCVARIETCETGGAEGILLDAVGESMLLTCGAAGSTTATAILAAPAVELRKPATGGPAALVSLAAGDTATLGSPVTASADNLQPIRVSLVDAANVPFGSFALDPGESVDVRFGLGTGTATVLAGTITLVLGGGATTLGPGQSLTFPTLGPLDLLDLLVSAIADFRTAGAIRNAGAARSLTASLENARAALARGQTRAARGMLAAFLQKLEAFARGGQITPAVHDALAVPVGPLLGTL